MSVSSGTVSLFSSVALFIAASAGAAYILKNRDGLYRTISDYSAVKSLHAKRPIDAESAPVSEDAAAAMVDASGDVTLRATGNGHFETTAEVNGRDVEVMVDTGATLVALTYEDAERAGIYLLPSEFTHQVSTANGVAKVAPVDIGSITIGSITVRNVRAVVSERGKLHRTLLGMTFLSRLSRVEMRKSDLVLHE